VKRKLLAAGALLLLAPVVTVEGGWIWARGQIEAIASVESHAWGPLERRLLGVGVEGVHIGELVWSPLSPRRVTLREVRVDLADEVGGQSQGDGRDIEVRVEKLDLMLGEELLAGGFSGTLGEPLVNPEGAQLGPGMHLVMTVPFPHEAVRGLVDLRVDAESWIIEASGSWTVEHPLLSSRPLSLPRAEVRLQGDPREGSTGSLRLGGVELSLRVADPLLEVELQLTDARQVLELVEDMLPELKHADLRGRLGGRASWDRESGAWSLEPVIEDLAVQGAVRNLEQLRWGPFSYRAFDADGEPVVRTSGEGTADWTPLRETSEHLPAAIIAAEDSAFLRHPGYDLQAIEAAITENQEAGDVVRGGSTLTQQLAKNLFLDGERTVERKLRELLLAVEIDRALGKDRVMELYINVVEWGPEIWGVQQACDNYFARRPATLPANEAAFLAAILPAPRDFYERWYLKGRAGSFKIDWVLTNMADGKHFSHARANRAKARPLRFVPPP